MARSCPPCHHPRMESWRPDEAHDDEERESAYELLQRGQALLERRHYAQAAIVLERADRLEPRRGPTFEALLDVDPSSPYGHYALGQSLKRLGRRQEAGTHLRLAVALSPETALYREALDRLG